VVASDDIFYASIATLRGWLHERRVSAVELSEAFLARLSQVGGALHAVAEIVEKSARDDARRADHALQCGEAGPICGIPYGVKDMIATAGVPTRLGVFPNGDKQYVDDAAVIERLRSAGAILIGKLSMIELAGAGPYRSTGASSDGACLNPWNTSRWAGGSSSGSAAAVAAGAVSFAIGSETMGSIMIPSAYCGVTGLRPSIGLISRYGTFELAWTMDKLGPIARSVTDCATLLTLLAGVDPRDEMTVAWQPRVEASRNFTIGVPHNPESISPATQSAFNAALSIFSELRFDIKEIQIPDLHFKALADTLASGEIAARHEDLILGPRLDSLMDNAHKDGLRKYLSQSPTAYPRAARERVAVVRKIRRLFTDVDAIVAPTVRTEAVTLDTDLVRYRRESRGGNMSLGALAGLPELTVPMGTGPSAMPVGMSIIGDVYSDSLILAIGELYQSVTDWHLRRPSV
jgi:aspartyl-tRNA(Asn)/glutamyl-tRNA(Gln) amidotransferase subunit A